MNKKKIIMIAAAAVLLMALAITVIAYDSSEDPLVSFSYLTTVFKPQIMSEVDTKINAKVGSASSSQPAASSSSSYEVVELKQGDALYAKDACDIMLRSGSVICVAPDEKQGIADYTDATEILNGKPLIKNHMCLIPRGDGRGVFATSASVYIMVRGNYSIVRK